MSDSIYGVDLDEDLPEGFQVSEVIVMVEGVDSDGVMSWAMRYSPGMTIAKRLGFLHIGVQMEEQMLWRRDNDD